MGLINTVIELIEQTGSLPAKYTTHKLRGNYTNFWECHKQPDRLLIWFYDNDKKKFILPEPARTAICFK